MQIEVDEENQQVNDDRELKTEARDIPGGPMDTSLLPSIRRHCAPKIWNMDPNVSFIIIE